MGLSIKQLYGTDCPSPDIIRRAQEFWSSVESAGGREIRFKTKAKKSNPSHSKNGVGLAWLHHFKDYCGDECLLFPFRTAATPRGGVTYGTTRMPAHRAMCLMANKLPPEGKSFALHRCGNGHLGCVNPGHLYWGDRSENSKDAAIHRKYGKPKAFASVVSDCSLPNSLNKHP